MKLIMAPKMRSRQLGLFGLGLLLATSLVQAKPTESFPVSISDSPSTEYLWEFYTNEVFHNDRHLGLEPIRSIIPETSQDNTPILPTFPELSDSEVKQSRPLPAGPASIFMVLMGFMCVSLVRDRRFWVVFLTGLVGFSLAGINLAPRWVGRVSHRNQQPPAEPVV